MLPMQDSPLHSLILRTIIDHLSPQPAQQGGGLTLRPPPGFLPPAQPGGFRPAPRPVQPPTQVYPGLRPPPSGLGVGPNQPAQQGHVSPYGIVSDPFGGGGYEPPRGLHRIISGLL